MNDLRHLCRFRRLCIGLCLLFSLTFLNLACQTGKDGIAQGRDQEVLEKQKTLVRNQLDEGKPEGALTLLRTLTRQFPKDASLQNLLGLTHLALKNPGRAIKHFSESYKLDRQPGTALNLSSAYIEGGDHAKAVKLLLALLKTKEMKGYPHRERVFHNLAYANEHAGNKTKAEEWYQEAIDENPTFFPSHLELARLYEQTGRPAMAIKAYRRATDYCHACFEPVYALSMLYMKTNKPAEARKILLSYGKMDGVAPGDRERAQQLLRLVTTAGITTKKAG